MDAAEAHAGEEPDALSILREQHREVEGLFDEFENLGFDGPRDKKEDLVRTACAKLALHSQIEEEVFYPAARNVEDARSLLNEAEVEHDMAKNLIASLDSMDARDEMFDATFTVLAEYVKHHVEKEESRLFPVLESSDFDLDRVDRELKERARGLEAAAEVA